MQLVKEGPDIPVEVLEAAEEGSLVLFCGAGISYPAGLRGFKWLVEEIYKQVDALPPSDPQEALELKRRNYDRVLGLLERRVGREIARAPIAGILKLDPAAAAKLTTHRALLELSKARDGTRRLVSTNFDLGFEVVAQEQGIKLSFDAAPKLPVPKRHKWNSLVYLHGRLDPVGDPHGQHLVLTSGDFGIAYLAERWASRFVSELFRRYTVLFIGYSVDDPVIRYMMDALAVDRDSGEGVRKAYVLAGYQGPRNKLSASQSWSAKNVEPILFNQKQKFKLLNETLKEWASRHSQGLAGHEGVVKRYAQKPPLAPYNETVEQVVWAVRSGGEQIAKLFADLDPLPPVEWLNVFEERGLLNQADTRRMGTANLVGHSVGLSDWPQLHPVTFQLGRWLARHAASSNLSAAQKVLDWVLSKGAVLHPAFAFSLKSCLPKSPYPALRTVWRVIAGRLVAGAAEEAVDWGELQEAVTDLAEPLAKQTIVRALSPSIRLRSRVLWLEDEAGAPEQPSSYVDAEIVLNVNQLDDELMRRVAEQPAAALAALADDATTLLKRAMELQQILGRAEDRGDLSFLQHPSIQPHEQNHYFSPWTHLIELCRLTWCALDSESPTDAAALVERWRSIRFPIFRRLVMYALAESSSFRAEDGAAFLLSDGCWWLWSGRTQREKFQLLGSIWAKLGARARTQLLDAIYAGPPRDMYISELTPEQWEEIRRREIGELLAKLRDSGGELPPDAEQMLLQLALEFDYLRSPLTDKRELPTWMEVHVGEDPRTAALLNELSPLAPREQADKLLARPNDQGLLEAWEAFGRAHRDKALPVLEELKRRNCQNEALWKAGLRSFNVEPSIGWNDGWALIEGLHPNTLQAAIRPLADWVETVSKDLPEAQEDDFLRLVDQLLDFALADTREISGDPVSAAINRPSGDLATALLHRLWARKPKAGQRLPDALRAPMTRICAAGAIGGRLARAVLASRLSQLFAIDPDWTSENLIWRFGWENPDESWAMWDGYLWGAHISPDLFGQLKHAFIQTVEHLDRLEEHSRQFLQLFTIAQLFIPGAFTSQELVAILRRLGDKERAEIASTIWREQAKANDPASFWEQRVRSWLRSGWPKDQAMRTASVSEGMSLIAIHAGEAFSAAVELVSPLLVPASNLPFVLRRLAKTQAPDDHPVEALQLMNRIIPEAGVEYDHETVQDLLQRIRGADPTLGNEPSFRRLDELSRGRAH